MKKKSQSTIAAGILLSLFTPGIAQLPTPSPAGKPGANLQEDKVRITTNLVQLDVIVTDKDGKQVTDLRPEEFELTEDGKKQAITNFSYISTLPASPTSGTIEPASTEPLPPSKSGDTTISVSPARLRPEQVRRTIAFLVDDLGVSMESMTFVRKALKKFVDEQMQPGDLVVILRTSGGTGALQQFTTDKRVLYAAIDNIRWLPRGRGNLSAFDSISPTENQLTDVFTREMMQDMQAFRAESMAIGTIGTLTLVLRNLINKPGRKSVVLFSENFRILDYNKQRSELLVKKMRQLADYSNRASAIVYTVDTSGVQPLNTTAVDSPLAAQLIPELNGRPPAGTRAAAAMDARGLESESGFAALNALAELGRNSYFESQSVLKYLADLTGGINIRNTNNISGGIERILEDQSGYYLVGYRPDESTIDPKTGQRRALNIKVKVNRPDLRVRTRNSFYGLSNEEKTGSGRTRDEQLQAALDSPFAGDMRLRLTSLFGKDQGKAPFVRAMVYVEARDLKFREEADKTHKAILDMVVLTMDASGRVVDQVNRTETVSAKGEAYDRLLRQGLTYVLNVPVRQAGAYQVRVAVRDAASEKTGSASQFVEIPDLAKGGLTISGIILYGLDLAAASQEPDAQSGPAVRRIKQGMALDYGYVIYNAQLNKSTKKPQVTTQIKLFRDGKLFFKGRVVPLNMNQQTDMKRLIVGGRLQIGTAIAPGDFVLQVIVTDMLGREKSVDRQRTATQWTDFEVVK